MVLWIGFWFWLSAGQVLAHMQLLESQPAPGAALTETPAEIRLHFSEAVQDGSNIVVFDAQFRPVGALEPVIDAGDPTLLTTQLPPLAAGVYTVQWSAVGSDGHATTGNYNFQVAEGAPVGRGAESGAGFWLPGIAVLLLILAVAGVWLRRRIRATR